LSDRRLRLRCGLLPNLLKRSKNAGSLSIEIGKTPFEISDLSAKCII
jgi:hypothetical protein